MLHGDTIYNAVIYTVVIYNDVIYIVMRYSFVTHSDAVFSGNVLSNIYLYLAIYGDVRACVHKFILAHFIVGLKGHKSRGFGPVHL